MARKPSGLEEHAELARRIHRWPALRNMPGDERAYQFAHAVQKLHYDILSNTVEIDAGLEDLAPLIQQIKKVKGGGGLFDEARNLAQSIEVLRAR